MNPLEEMMFDNLTPNEVPVRIGTQRYILREASADAARQFRNAAATGAIISEGKVQTGERVGDIQPLLVSQCLFKVDEFDEATNAILKVSPVPYQMVLNWPDRVVSDLFNAIRDISPALKTDLEKPAKN